MVPPLQVAVFGDSWVSDYERGEHADYWNLESHLPEGLRQRLSADASCEVDLVIAGFPGFTAARLLEFAELCRLRDMAHVYHHRGCYLPLQGDLKTLLLARNIPCAWADERDLVSEDVDIVVIIAGYNDLKYGAFKADEVAGKLLALRGLYAARGVEAVLVTVGEGSPDLEAQRHRVNELLLADGGTVGCDEFVRALGRDMWANMDHFTPEGYRALGGMLGSAIACRLGSSLACPLQSSRSDGAPESHLTRRPWGESAHESCKAHKRRWRSSQSWPPKRSRL